MAGILDRIDIPGIVAKTPEGEWLNTELTRVNEANVRLGVVQGEYHWHSHAAEDEFFLTLDGELLVDARTREGEETLVLAPHEGCTVPAGVEHRTRAPGRTVILMVEMASAVPEGN